MANLNKQFLGVDTIYTLNGTWKITENKLLMTSHNGEQENDINYTYELKKDTLTLTLYSPDRQNKLVVALRKKNL